jgi:IS605 OrfB family transposase
MGEHQRKLFEFRKGEVDLMYRKGEFYLNAVCDVPEEKEFEPKDILGVDFGIVELVSDSDGEQFSGKQIEKVRQTFAHRRRNLQRKQTKSAKRKLKQLSGKQNRFQKNENHIISKRLVEKAKHTQRAISLEDLKEIRSRIRVRKAQRHRLNNWSFFDLRAKIEYKAKLSGVKVIAVSPKNTSRECSQCHFVSKSNRKSQSEFVCQQCGFADNADSNASRNIRERATVKLPNDRNIKVANL